MKAIYFVFALLLLGSVAQAQTPVVTGSQIHQQKRIQEGKRSGELTRAETARLQRQQMRVQRSKKQAKADGTVTVAERRAIRRQQKRSSTNILRQKHDRQSR